MRGTLPRTYTVTERDHLKPNHLSPETIDFLIIAAEQYAIPALSELASVGRLRGDDLPAMRAALRNLRKYKSERRRILRQWRKECGPTWDRPETVSCPECGYTIHGEKPEIECVCAECYTPND